MEVEGLKPSSVYIFQVGHVFRNIQKALIDNKVLTKQCRMYAYMLKWQMRSYENMM